MRKIVYMIWILILSGIVTGCFAGEGFEDYMDAIHRTDQMQKGASRMEAEVVSIMNENLINKLSNNERNEISGLEHVKLTIEDHFDHEVSNRKMDVYLYQNDLGVDLKLYQLGPEELYLIIPFMKGTYKVDGATNQTFVTEENVEALFDLIGQNWNGMLSAENVFVGERTLIKSEDGEIKATKFTVKPTSTQLNAFTKQLKIVILDHYEVLSQFIKNLNTQNTDAELTEEVYREIVEALFSSMTIKRYEEVAFMNLDGYIVDELIEIEIDYADSSTFENIFSSQTIRIKSNKWDIERNQTFDFSSLNLNDVKPVESLMNGGLKNDR